MFSARQPNFTSKMRFYFFQKTNFNAIADIPDLDKTFRECEKLIQNKTRKVLKKSLARKSFMNHKGSQINPLPCEYMK